MRDRAVAGTLQARLLRVLMVSLCGLLLLGVGVTWFVAFRVANDAYDHALLDPVMDIVQNVREGPSGPALELSAREQQALLFDGSDRVFFGVRDAAGRWYSGAAASIPPPHERLVPRVPLFYSATVNGAEVRIASMLTDAGFEVYVAETTNKRDRLVWEVILTSLVPSLAVVVVAVALVWFGVSHGLSPLRRLHDELAQRSPNDLRAVDVSQAPAARDAAIDLQELVERVGAQWIAPALDRGIDLGFELAPASVHGDAALIADMLQNLIDNAVRYTDAGGTITVSCGDDARGAWFAVEDSGIGIPAEERERVFERFYRGTAAGGDGCGLGLAIVKEGADRHRASVSIDDASAGAGTLITVRFPAPRASRLASAPASYETA